MRDPDAFQADSFRRKADMFGPGIDGILGKLTGDDAMTLQAVRFDAARYTAAEARQWLREHDMKPILFEEATGGDDKAATVHVQEVELTRKAYEPLQGMMQLSEPHDAERVIRFRASDETVDRMGDVIMQDGWDFSDYIKNPIVTAFHDGHLWPIGQAVALGVVGRELLIDAEFDPPDIDEEADKVLLKIKHGSIRAGSVAFMPTAEPSTRRDETLNPLFQKFSTARRIFTKQSLLEWTICPIPCNPNAIAASLHGRMAVAKRHVEKPDVDREGDGKSLARLIDALAWREAERKAIRISDRRKRT